MNHSLCAAFRLGNEEVQMHAQSVPVHLGTGVDKHVNLNVNGI